MIAGKTVTLIRTSVTGRDGHGNDIRTPTETDIRECVVYPSSGTTPGSSSERDDFRTQVVSGLTVVFPAGTTVYPTDRVRARGVVYEVDGSPTEWRQLTTHAGWGIEVQLKKVTG